MQRKIPIFRVVLSNGADFETVKNHPEIQRTVIEESLIAIKEALQKKRKTTHLFIVYNTDMVLELDETNYKKCLNHIQKYYIGIQDYDKCIEIRELIKKLP